MGGLFGQLQQWSKARPGRVALYPLTLTLTLTLTPTLTLTLTLPLTLTLTRSRRAVP